MIEHTGLRARAVPILLEHPVPRSTLRNREPHPYLASNQTNAVAISFLNIESIPDGHYHIYARVWWFVKLHQSEKQVNITKFEPAYIIWLLCICKLSISGQPRLWVCSIAEFVEYLIAIMGMIPTVPWWYPHPHRIPSSTFSIEPSRTHGGFTVKSNYVSTGEEHTRELTMPWWKAWFLWHRRCKWA